MEEPNRDENLVDDLAEEFARRLRAGEQPTAEEYVARHPERAAEIRAVLSAVSMMEQLKPRREDDRSARAPDRIGDFRIVREIGRGGMGVVYEARQEALGRRVAVKVLPAHLLGDDRSRSRFRRESQAAARLHHTNIVPVFATGESDGQCYYVMQLIEGRGLDQVIRDENPAETDADVTDLYAEGKDQPGARVTGRASQSPERERRDTRPLPNGRGSDGPRRSRSGLVGADYTSTVSLPADAFQAVAQVGRQAADALAYAHSQGVLHRDVKPSNLLLDDRGGVWVTDFGVAKLVEEAAHLTHSGELVGTLKYMPPERFAGQTDARGDVYSLGVTMYEMLTRQPAFPDTNPQHLIHLITEESPVPPRSLNRAIPRDLETIVLKASARDPDRRYQTAAELAEDLRRFLDDRPILARRAGPVELLWRWCRRNPALAAVTAAALVLMGAVTTVSLVGYARTSAANAEAAKALDAEMAQREQAEQLATLSLEGLNRTYERFAPTRLVATPQTANEQGVEVPPPALPPEAVPLLEDLLRTYEHVARAGGAFPKLQQQAAEANFRIGDICQRLGRHLEAATAYQSAIDLYAKLLAETNAPETHVKLARAHNDLGRALRVVQQYDEAARAHESAIRELSAEGAVGRPECRYELARAYALLGQRDLMLSPGLPMGKGPKGPRGKPPLRGLGSEHPIEKAVALLEPLTRDHSSVPEYRHLLACCYRDLPGRADRAVTLLRQLMKDFPNVPDYQFDLCETLGRFQPPFFEVGGGRRKRLEEAVSLSEKLVTRYPNVPDYAAARARYLDQLGMLLTASGKASEAEPLHRQAVEIQTRLVKQAPKVVAYAFWLSLMERSLGHALVERGELKEGRARIESAIERAESLRKQDPRLAGLRPFLMMAYHDLAKALGLAGESMLAATARRMAEQVGKERPTLPRGAGRP